MPTSLNEYAEVYAIIALFFGPALMAIFGTRRLIRKKKRSMDPGTRCGIAACRILFYGLSLLVIVVAVELATYTQHHPGSNALGLLLGSLWILPIFFVMPSAFITWMVEIILFKTRPKSKSQPTPLPPEA